MCHNQSNHTWYVHHHTHSFNIILKSRTVMTSWRSALFQSFQLTAPNNCENADIVFSLRSTDTSYPYIQHHFETVNLVGVLSFSRMLSCDAASRPVYHVQQILWLEVTHRNAGHLNPSPWQNSNNQHVRISISKQTSDYSIKFKHGC